MCFVRVNRFTGSKLLISAKMQANQKYNAEMCCNFFLPRTSCSFITISRGEKKQLMNLKTASANYEQ